MVGILEDRGLINFDDPVGPVHINDLKNSAYGDITIENLINMASGFDCAQIIISIKDRVIIEYSSAIGDGYWTEESPENPYIFVATLTPEKIHDKEQNISIQVDTFVHFRMVDRNGLGMPLHDVITKEIWMKIGAEADGLMIAPRFGFLLCMEV